MTDRDGGIELDPSSVTVNEYLQRWLNDSVKGSVRPITFESYERLVRVHVVPALGRVKLKALSPAHLQGLYRDRLDAGLSSSTVQRLHAVIHRALKQALRWDLVPRNVSEAVDPPKAQRKEIRPLTPAQVRTLLRTAEEDRLGALYALAITTGLRQGSLLVTPALRQVVFEPHLRGFYPECGFRHTEAGLLRLTKPREGR
jgi:integrase